MPLVLKHPLEVIHKLPANFISDDGQEFIPEQRYKTNQVIFLGHNAVTVSSDSVVYSNNLLVTDSLPANAGKGYYRFRYLLKHILKGKKMRLEGNNYLLATDIWSSGHFHWFCDVLPRLYCLKGHTEGFRLLLPDTPYIKNIGVESLSALGLQFSDITWMKKGCMYSLKKLFRISHVAPSGHMNPGIMQKIQQAFIKNAHGGMRRIYITRESAEYRRIINEKELLPILRNFGFEICQAESLTFSEQLLLFSEANTLMGIHGAGLTNMIFMKPESNVIELRKKEGGPSNVGYWHLADSLRQKYYYYNGQADSSLSIVGRGSNLFIPENELNSLLTSIFQNN